MAFEADNFEVNIISMRYNLEAPKCKPFMEYDAYDFQRSTLTERSYYTEILDKIRGKLASRTQVVVSNWYVKSQDREHFKFPNGYYDDILFIIGNGLLYWAAERKGSDKHWMHGALKIPQHTRFYRMSIDMVEHFLLRIKKRIATDKFVQKR